MEHGKGGVVSGGDLWGEKSLGQSFEESGKVTGKRCAFALLSAPRPPPQPWGPGPLTRGALQCRRVQGGCGEAAPQVRPVFAVL